MNNFDTSKSGVDIEVECFYSNNLAGLYFDEDFERVSNLNGASLLHDNYFNVGIYQYVAGGEYDAIEVTDLANYTTTNKDMKQLLIDLFNKEELNDYFDKSYRTLNKAELTELVSEMMTRYYDASSIVEFYTTCFTPNYDVIAIRGYSQGDYAEIIVPKEASKAEEFAHMFYDAPIICAITIDNKEYYLHEGLSSEYEWDKAEILATLDKQLNHYKKAYIMEWVNEHLETPTYR